MKTIKNRRLGFQHYKTRVSASLIVLSWSALSYGAPVSTSSNQSPQVPGSSAGSKLSSPIRTHSKAIATKALTALRRSSAWVSSAYLAMVKLWHSPSVKPVARDVYGREALRLVSINRGEEVELIPTSEEGDFAPTEIDKASFIMRADQEAQHPVDSRLLNILYQIQKHFKSREIRFVSGYRRGKGNSNHHYGRALDLVVPGATNEDVAAFARTFGFVGVGVYPTSGFVHVDVRSKSFFWSDSSGPGRRNRTVGILHNEATVADVQASKQGYKGSGSTAIEPRIHPTLTGPSQDITHEHSHSEDLSDE